MIGINLKETATTALPLIIVSQYLDHRSGSSCYVSTNL